MNKKLFLPILFLMFFNMAMSQRFDAGILAGFNASQVTNAQLNGIPIRGFNKPGILAGIWHRLSLPEWKLNIRKKAPEKK